MSIVDRKLCAGCGEANLSGDLRCWACGGSQFAPPNTRPVGERTVQIGHAFEATQAWEREHPRWMPLVYLSAAAAVAVFMWILGFWIGRAGGDPPAVAQAPTPAAPIVLPTPPTLLRANPGPASSGAPVPAAVLPVDPQVKVRSVASAGATPPAAKAAPNGPPTTVVYNSPTPATMSAPTRVTTVYSQVRGPAPLPAIEPKMPAATSKTSVVRLRNDTSGTIEVHFEGAASQTATVGAGSTLPMILTPGSYQMRVSGTHAAPGRSAAVLAAGKSYSLVVDGRSDEGSTRLVILEPGLDGG